MASRYDSSDGLSQLADLMTGPAERRPWPPVDPSAGRRRRRIRLIVGGIVAVVVIALVGGYAGYALTAPIGAATARLQQPAVAEPAAAKLVMPSEGESAVSVAGADSYLGSGASGVWATSGGDAAVPMASISKLITAMVVLKAKPLSSATDPGPTITFDKADHDLYDAYYVLNATIAPMPTGSSLSEHDALETMLVVSACNYAEALAEWAYGSDAAFLSATRSWLAAHGMTHTTMAEPTGLDERNRSTPADLIALGKLAMANPAIAAMVSTRTLDLPGTAVNGMGNTNDLLGTDGVDGIKTGTLDTGSDLLFSSQLTVTGIPNPLTVTGVVLGGASRSSVDDDVHELLHSIVAGFHEVDLGQQGDVVGRYTTAWGASSPMVLDASPSVLVWSDPAIRSSMTTSTLTTGSAGERVGTVTWTVGTTRFTAPVVLRDPIRPPDAWWRLTHPAALGAR